MFECRARASNARLEAALLRWGTSRVGTCTLTSSVVCVRDGRNDGAVLCAVVPLATPWISMAMQMADDGRSARGTAAANRRHIAKRGAATANLATGTRVAVTSVSTAERKDASTAIAIELIIIYAACAAVRPSH